MNGWTADSRPKLLAGSPEGYIGHIDGRPREARMNHPKGLAVDDRGNIYIADTMNMAIRKISDEGIHAMPGALKSVKRMKWMNQYAEILKSQTVMLFVHSHLDKY